MSASCLVAETIWKEIESTHKVNDDQLWTLVNCFPFLSVLFRSLLPRIVFLLKLFFWSLCNMKPVCISCLARTSREPLELLTKEVSTRYPLTPVEGLSFRLQENPEEKTNISVLQRIFVLVILSSMMSSTEENNFVVNIS